MTLAIFDLDGTLADTLADLADATNYGLRVMSCPEHGYDEYRYFVGNGAMKLCERALPEGRKHEAERLHSLFSEYYGVHYLDKTELYNGTREMLARLTESGATVAIATNKPQTFAREIAAALLPEIQFAAVLGGCDERPKKPDTAIISEILSPLPEVPEKVFMVGDSAVDIMTARNAGLVSIGCVWGFRGRDELTEAGADFLAERPLDIADIILNNK